MTKKQILLWLSIIAALLAVNTVVHFTSPAYREYRANLELVRAECHSLSNALIRFNQVIMTNLITDISRQMDASALLAADSPVGARMRADNGESAAPNPDAIKRAKITLPKGCHAAQCNNQLFVVVKGWSYSLGDNFGGSSIIDITPLGFSTLDTDYQFQTNDRKELLPL